MAVHLRERSSSQAKNYFLLVGGIALGFAGPSCLTNHLVPTTKPSTTSVETTSSEELTTTQTFSVVTLARVVKSSSNPGANFDLIGDGSGGLGSFCNVAAQNGSTACACEFNYIRSDGSSEKFDSNTIYTENDLIRCSYTQLPSDISFVDVRVHILNSDSFSNSITFRFGSDTTSLNLADSSSFTQMKRYQCKEFLTIGYLLDGNVYDPIASIDPEYAYPRNYYTNNMGASIAFFNRNATPASGAGFNCPSIPNDSAAGMDLTVYSVGSDGASKRIFPTQGSRTDRHTFSLAKQSSGVFSRPVNAVYAPNTVTSTTGDGVSVPAPLGFGANPIPGTSTDTESCPSDVQIPSGFKWVKLWLFRASLARRTVSQPSEILGVQAIGCNPGAFPNNGSPRPIFTECATPTTDGTLSPSSSGSTALGDRVLFGTQTCFSLNGANFTSGAFCSDNATQSGVGCTTNAGTGNQKTGFDIFGKGTDIWSLSSTSALCGVGLANDVLGLCAPVSGQSVPASDGPFNTVQLDQDARQDFLFVVSPPEVNTRDIQNKTALGKAFIPYRFYSQNDCLSSDPDFPTSGDDCRIERKITYDMITTDINNQADAPGNDPQRSPAFPICAIQPE